MLENTPHEEKFVMKRISISCGLIFFLLAGTCFGQANRFGLGLVLFDPSGLTAKIWLKKAGAIDGALGWSGMEPHNLQVQADYLFFSTPIASDQNIQFSFYLGVGGKVIFQDNDNAWFRIPLGFDVVLKKTPLNIFFEIAPSFDFDEINLYGAIGVRYIFTQ